MPQIAQLSETYASQIFWLLIIFGFIFFVIGNGMLPRVMATVEARDGQISADLAAAEAARRAADEAEIAWGQQSAAQRAQAQALILLISRPSLALLNSRLPTPQAMKSQK